MKRDLFSWVHTGIIFLFSLFLFPSIINAKNAEEMLSNSPTPDNGNATYTIKILALYTNDVGYEDTLKINGLVLHDGINGVISFETGLGKSTKVIIRETAKYHYVSLDWNGYSINKVDSIIFSDDNMVGDVELTIHYDEHCDIRTLPFVEGFDVLNTFPDCWGTTGATAKPIINTATAHNTPNSINIGSTAGNAILVCPPLAQDIEAKNILVKYAFHPNRSDCILEVGVMTDPNDATTFESLDTAVIVGTGRWSDQITYFNNYKGNGKYIAFRAANNTFSNYIDDVRLEEQPSCLPVKNLKTTGVGTNAIYLSWETNDKNITDFIVKHKIKGSSSWSNSQIVSATTFSLGGLTSGETYLIQVSSDCSEVESEPKELEVSTVCYRVDGDCSSSFCEALNIVRITNITSNSADISWVPEGDALSFQLEYSANGLSWISAGELHDNNYSLTSLSAATTYNVRIKTICGAISSDSLKRFNFTTAAEPVVCETIKTIPYKEYFDGYTASTFPSCWNRYTTVLAATLPVMNVAGINAKTVPALHFGTINQAYSMAIMPAIDESIAISELEVDFWAKIRENVNGLLLVGIAENPNDMRSFTPVDTIRTSTMTDFEFKTTSFKDYAGNGKHIAFMWKYGTAAATVDDIEIRYNSNTCITPTNLAMDSVTTNSVYFSWSDLFNQNWKAVCMPGNAQPAWDNATSFNTVTNGAISGLLPKTKYTLYFVADCSGETSRTLSFSFTTECEDIEQGTLPYMESFDTYGTDMYATSFPTCWRRMSSSAPFITSVLHFSGQGSLFFNYKGEPEPLMAITEKVNANLSNLLLTFKLRGNISNYGFVVGVMTDPSDASSFNAVANVVVENENSWEDKIISFKEYQGVGEYIAFKVGEDPEFGNCSFYMDNLVISDIGACAAPDLIKTIAVTRSEASISWRENGEATRWVIAYGAPGFNPNNNEGDTVSVSVSQYIIPNLTPNTDYEVYVRADCGGGNFSMWSVLSATFRTKLVPAILPYTCDFESDYENESWGLLNTYQTNQWHYGSATHNGGSKALYISNNNGLNNEYTLNSPSYVYAVKTFNFTEQGVYEFDFDWKANGNNHNDVLRAFIVPDNVVLYAGDANGMAAAANNPPENWIAIDNGPLYGKNSWEHVHAKIDVSNTGYYNLVFFWKNHSFTSGRQSPAAIDNVSVIFISCPTPENIASTKVTATSATIQWREMRKATEWEIQYGPEGFSVETGTSAYPIKDNYEITGLSPAKSYDLYVRSLCSSSDLSAWSKKFSFTTLCQIENAELPYFDNFDGYDDGVTIPNTNRSVIPDCWFVSKTGTSANPYIAQWGASFAHSQPYVLDFGYTAEGYSLAIMPEISSDININSLKLSFWGKTGNGPGVLSVGLMDDPYTNSTFSVLESWKGIGNEWELLTTYLADFSGTGRHLAFKWEGGEANSFTLDDMTIALISESDTCSRPQDLSVNNIAQQSADVSWSAGEATSWEIAYKEASESAYNPAVVCNSANYTLTDLTAETDYDVRIRTICDGNKESVWVVSHFKTADIPYIYTITPLSSPNGVVYPSETVYINRGEDTTFTFTPNQGYEIGEVVINNVIQGAISSYRFTNVQQNYNIYVAFVASTVVPDSVTITAVAGPHGTISPIGEIRVEKGKDQTFVFTPDSLYEVKKVLLNEDSVSNAGTYIMTNVQADATIRVEFQQKDIAVPQYVLDQTVLIYPNPVQDYIRIKLNTGFDQIEITNLLGQVIYNAMVNDSEFEIKTSDYQSGVYFIRLQGKQGVVTKKFVKE